MSDALAGGLSPYGGNVLIPVTWAYGLKYTLGSMNMK